MSLLGSMVASQHQYLPVFDAEALKIELQQNHVKLSLRAIVCECQVSQILTLYESLDLLE